MAGNVLNYATPNLTPGIWKRFFRSCPGRPLGIATLIASLLTFWAFRFPSGELMIVALSIVAWMAVLAVWVLRILIWSIVVLSDGVSDKSTAGRRAAKWLATPALLVVVIISVGLALPARIAFFLSRPTLERAAKAHLASPSSPQPNRWIGAYEIAGIESFPGGARLVVTGTFLDRHGFAYCPSGSPADTERVTYRRFAGCWYVWHESPD